MATNLDEKYNTMKTSAVQVAHCFVEIKNSEAVNRIIDKLVCLNVTHERKRLIAYSDAIHFHYR